LMLMLLSLSSESSTVTFIPLPGISRRNLMDI
jgi:hypothetical protein